jgi:hypothetical protein
LPLWHKFGFVAEANIDGRLEADGRARSLANLRPAQKGDIRNPFGRRGRPDRQTERDWLDAPDGEGEGAKPRIEKVLEAAYVEALAGSEVAQKTLIERRFGRPGPAEEEAALVIAEHCRKVERDRVDLALRLLGPRAYTMSPAELVKFFQECAENVRGFLAQAEEKLQPTPDPAVSAGPNASPKDRDMADHAPNEHQNAGSGGGDAKGEP